ncbi:MAG: DMT family transporter [Candidatus Cloacimonetes bacterium]|nr:DMT family transporter [Candidatus Cloacimonadota bacterium]
MKGISYLYCFIAVFFFSTNELVGKLIGTGISPAMITIVRFLIGFIVLLPFTTFFEKKGSLTLNLTDIIRISLPGIVNVVGAMLFLQLAVYYGKASTSAILISSNPIFVYFFATVILKERLSRGMLLGIVLGFSGIIFVIRGDLPSLVTGTNPSLGLFFGVLASVTFALFTVLAKKQILIYGNLLFNEVSFVVGALVLLVVSIIIGLDMTFVINGTNIKYIIYLGLFVTVAAYVFYFAGLKNISTGNGSMIFFLKPFLASGLSWLILGEKISALQFVGIVLILGGIYRCIVDEKGRGRELVGSK